MLFFGDARIQPGTDPAPYLEAEIAEVDRLMSAGFIRQLFRHLDGSGAILIIEAASLEDARAGLQGLPFVQHAIMRIPVTPIDERPHPSAASSIPSPSDT